MRKKQVLIGCEFSGTVRDAFLRRGIYAVSCDFLPSRSAMGKHYQGNVLDLLQLGCWDLFIAHPDCTFLCSSGLHWNNRGRGWEETEKALAFVRLLMDAPIPRIAIENPQGCIGTQIKKASQYIHPHQFGHDASKKNRSVVKESPAPDPDITLPAANRQRQKTMG